MSPSLTLWKQPQVHAARVARPRCCVVSGSCECGLLIGQSELIGGLGIRAALCLEPPPCERGPARHLAECFSKDGAFSLQSLRGLRTCSIFLLSGCSQRHELCSHPQLLHNTLRDSLNWRGRVKGHLIGLLTIWRWPTPTRAPSACRSFCRVRQLIELLVCEFSPAHAGL